MLLGYTCQMCGLPMEQPLVSSIFQELDDVASDKERKRLRGQEMKVIKRQDAIYNAELMPLFWEGTSPILELFEEKGWQRLEYKSSENLGYAREGELSDGFALMQDRFNPSHQAIIYASFQGSSTETVAIRPRDWNFDMYEEST